MNRGKDIVYLVMLGLFILSSSCATTKNRKEASKFKKLYHNTTAKYNGYFNANVLMDESILTLESDYKENFTKILPIYKYERVEDPTIVSSNLDQAIEKSSIVIELHRISQWVDDCYLLIGKAQYIKRDYEAAEETLEYLVDEYNPLSYKAKPEQSKSGKSRSKSDSNKRKKENEQNAKDRAKINRQLQKERAKKAKNGRTSVVRKKPKPTAKDSSATAAVNNKPVRTESKPTSEAVSLTSDTDDGMFAHKPAYYDGMLWLAKTYIERENFIAAETTLKLLRKEPGITEEASKELSVVEAQYAIKRENYPAAISALTDAISKTNDKKMAARSYFVLAQLHQKSGNQSEAYNNFKKVLENRPSYDVEFNSKLQLALTGWTSGSRTSKDVTTELNRMLKEEKFLEYRDQIYFTLASLAQAGNNSEDAIKYLQLSARSSVNNNIQKAESYYLLANMFYENQIYDQAKYYYDSTAMVMSKSDERYPEVVNLGKSLTDIARHMKNITLQDSLIRISQMSDKEKRKLALKLEREKTAALQAKQAKQNLVSQVNKTNLPAQSKLTAGGSSSSFFAYNPKAVKKGSKNFLKDWGARELADNWRVSSIRGPSAGRNKITKDEDDFKQEDLDKIFRDVPKDEKQLKEAHDKIANSMYELGTLLRDRLDNFKQSADVLEKLLEKYPETKKRVDAYYYLYLCHDALGNDSEAEKYKSKILQEFPESLYSKIIKDPGYAQLIMKEESKIDRYYDDTYLAFENGKYEVVKTRVKNANNEYGDKNKYKAKFALVNAMAIGKLEGRDAYIKSLKSVIANYPSTPEQVRASEMLRFIYGNEQAFKEGSSVSDKFTINHNLLHYVIAVIPVPGDKKIQDIKIDISKFNSKYHQADKLRLTNIFLDQKATIPLVLVRRFANKDKAMLYYNSIQAKKAEYLEGIEYEVFPITQSNYREVIVSRSIEDYRAFFLQNYFDK